jgi:uncharacterized protein (TIGR00725 family)
MIAVVGAAQCSADEATLAETVGRELAKRGIGLVCGGGGGVMEAASRGAQAEGGLVVGILPGASPAEGNPHLTVALATGLGHARNTLVVLGGEAVIAVGGGYGTLSEIALALKVGRRVIGLGTWEAARPDGSPAEIVRAGSAVEAVEMAVGSRRPVGGVGAVWR